jgi:hypothetical protein
MNDNLVLLLLVLFVVAIIGGVWFLVSQTRKKGRYGIGEILNNKCPRCATAMPAVRAPASWQESLWGGWTCPNCGCKVDKYGRERST